MFPSEPGAKTFLFGRGTRIMAPGPDAGRSSGALRAPELKTTSGGPGPLPRRPPGTWIHCFGYFLSSYIFFSRVFWKEAMQSFAVQLCGNGKPSSNTFLPKNNCTMCMYRYICTMTPWYGVGTYRYAWEQTMRNLLVGT